MYQEIRGNKNPEHKTWKHFREKKPKNLRKLEK